MKQQQQNNRISGMKEKDFSRKSRDPFHFSKKKSSQIEIGIYYLDMITGSV